MDVLDGCLGRLVPRLGDPLVDLGEQVKGQHQAAVLVQTTHHLQRTGRARRRHLPTHTQERQTMAASTRGTSMDEQGGAL